MYNTHHKLALFTDNDSCHQAHTRTCTNNNTYTNLGNKTGHLVAIELVGVITVHIDKCHIFASKETAVSCLRGNTKACKLGSLPWDTSTESLLGEFMQLATAKEFLVGLESQIMGHSSCGWSATSTAARQRVKHAPTGRKSSDKEIQTKKRESQRQEEGKRRTTSVSPPPLSTTLFYVHVLKITCQWKPGLSSAS